MKAININGQIRTFYKIPSIWEEKPNILGYDKLTDLHYEDGWRDYVEPTLLSNQNVGGLIFDSENDVFTRNVINLTNEQITKKYKDLIEESFSYLYIRALASSMNKSRLDLNFLTAQREVYQDKYDVAKGNITSGVKYDNTLELIQGEMIDEFSEEVLNTVLPTYGITPEGTHLNKMYQLIIFKFEFGLNSFSNFKKFIERFRTKCFTWLDIQEYNKIEQGLTLAKSLPDALTLQEAEDIYNQFNLI